MTSIPGVSGYEVIRGGGGMSVRDLKPTDIVTKVVYEKPYRQSGGRSSSGRVSQQQSSLTPQQIKEKEVVKQVVKPLTREQLQQLQQSQRLEKALTIQEKLRQKAKETGRGFSKREIQRNLKQQGSSLRDLREANIAASDVYKKTGVSVRKQIKEKIAQEKKPVEITSEVTPTKYITPGKIDRTGQVYNSKTGMYQKEAYTPGAGGTAIMLSPTYEESKAIEQAKYQGSFERIKDKEVTGLKIYEEKVVKPVGESFLFKQYKEKVVDRVSKYVTKPSTNILVSGIKKYEEVVVKPLRRAIPSLGDTPLGRLAEAKRRIDKMQPGQTVPIGLPGQVRQVEVSKLQKMGLFEFGKEVVTGEVEKSSTRIAKYRGIENPEQFGKAAKLTSEFGVYAVPGYFATEVGVGVGEAVTGGKFGGSKNVIEYAKKHPVELAVAVTLGVASGVKFLKGTSKEARFLKYLEQPEAKVVKIESKLYKGEVKTDIIKPKIRYEETPKFKMLDLFKKKKGEDVLTTISSRGKSAGKVVEVRGGKSYLGVVRKEGSKTTEVMNYGKVKRVVESEQGKKDIVTLYNKRGKKLYKFEREATKPIKLKSVKPKEETIKVDETYQPQYKKKELTIIEGGKKKKSIDVEGEIFLDKIEPAKKVIADIKFTKTEQANIEKGLFKYSTDVQAYTDVTKVSPRTGYVQFKKGNKIIKVKQEVGQKLEFGKDTSFDSTRIFKKNGIIKASEVSPKIDIQATQLSGRKETSIFLKPGTKSQLALEQAKESKQLAKQLAEQERKKTLEAIDMNIGIKKANLVNKETKVSQILKELTKEATEQLEKLKTITYIKQPKIVLPPVQKSKVPLVLSVSDYKPYKTSGLVNPKVVLAQQSVYTGTGQYEKTEVMSPSLLMNRLETKQKITPLVKTDIAQIQLLETKLATKIDTKLATRLDTRLATKLATKLDTKLDTRLETKLATRLDTRLATKLAIKPLRTTREIISERPSDPRPKTIPKIIPIKLLTPSVSKVKELAKAIGEDFDIFVRKAGKDIKIESKGTSKEAVKLLKKKLTGTIAASGFIEKGGKRISVKELGITNGEFRVSKLDSFRVVQRKGKRLSTGSETKQIQYFRSSGGLLGSSRRKKSGFSFL